MKYQYLLIDNDNTLMDFNAAEAKALVDVLRAHRLPTDDATVHTYHEINDALWKALERGETTQPLLKVERFRQLLAHLNRADIDPAVLGAEYAAGLGNHADLLPGAADFLHAVHGRMKIALVSNGVSAIQRSRLAKCPLTPLFDAIVLSGEVGVHKPDRRVFDLAARRLGVANEECVFVGDNPDADIVGAINAGMEAVWIDVWDEGDLFAGNPNVHRVKSVLEYFQF